MINRYKKLLCSSLKQPWTRRFVFFFCFFWHSSHFHSYQQTCNFFSPIFQHTHNSPMEDTAMSGCRWDDDCDGRMSLRWPSRIYHFTVNLFLSSLCSIYIAAYVAVPCRNRRLFVTYFEHIAVLEVPYRWTSVKGGAHTFNIDAWISNESTKCIWTLPLTEVQQYGASKAAMRSKYATE